MARPPALLLDGHAGGGKLVEGSVAVAGF